MKHRIIYGIIDTRYWSGTEKMRNTLTTRLRLQLPNQRKIFAIYALMLLMYTVANPDPTPRGRGQLPNPKSAILC